MTYQEPTAHRKKKRRVATLAHVFLREEIRNFFQIANSCSMEFPRYAKAEEPSHIKPCAYRVFCLHQLLLSLSNHQTMNSEEILGFCDHRHCMMIGAGVERGMQIITYLSLVFHGSTLWWAFGVTQGHEGAAACVLEKSIVEPFRASERYLNFGLHQGPNFFHDVLHTSFQIDELDVPS
jgi:hypothetical protein